MFSLMLRERESKKGLTMSKDEAMALVEVFRKLCIKHGLWMTTQFEEKPDLRMVRITEISIKIDK
jgi:hypothetical protein